VTFKGPTDVDDAQLIFKPACDSTKVKLRIEVNDKAIYEKVPSCNKATYVDIAVGNLKASNKLTFYSAVKESYRIEDIEVKLTTEDDTDIRDLGYVRLEEEFFDSEQIKDIGDDHVSTEIVHTVSLSSAQIKQDLLLKWESEVHEGNLVVYFNSRQIYKGQAKNVHEITIAKKFLKKGKNTVTFLAYK